MPVFLTEHFAHEFLPAIPALGHGGVGVGFLQGPDLRIFLEEGVVNAGGTGIEITAHAGLVGGFEQVRIDENGPQAFDAETFDEAHAPHVGGEVVNLGRALAGAPAVLLLTQVEAEIRDAGQHPIPLAERLLVHGADIRESLLLEVEREVAANEPAAAGDDDQVVLLQGRILFYRSGCGHKFDS